MIRARWHLILVAALVVSSGGAVVGCQPAPPVVLNFSSSPTQIDAGEPATLTWVVKDATSVSIDQGIGVVANAGNREVSPSATTTYTLVASNSGGAIAESVVITVDATSPPDSDTTAPVITSVLASSVTGTSAVIAWTTDEAATSQVEYGTTTSYGSTSALDEELVTSHSVSVTGLEGDTTYHFRVKSEDVAENEAVSTDETFTTSAEADTTPPVISEVDASDVTDLGATITWTTDEAATSQVEYGTTSDNVSATALDEELVASHSVTLTGLEGDTTYHFRVQSRDASGNEAVSSEGTFTTTAVIASPLRYRKLDSFSTEAVKDVEQHASLRGYQLPGDVVEWPDWALYIVVQNLDDVAGTFEIHYILGTADKSATEKQQFLSQRTPEEYAELDREYYEGSIELYLEPLEVGVAICPSDGIHMAPDRVPFSHEHEIIP